MTYPFMKCAQASQMPLQGIINLPLKVSSAIEVLSIVNWIGVLPICCLKGSCIGHPNGQFTATITQICGYYVEVQFTHSTHENDCSTHITRFFPYEDDIEVQGKRVKCTRCSTNWLVPKNHSVTEKKTHNSLFNNFGNNYMAKIRFFIDEEKCDIEINIVHIMEHSNMRNVQIIMRKILRFTVFVVTISPIPQVVT